MSELRITYEQGGYQVIESANGLEPWAKRGPRWPTPKEAARHFDRELRRSAVSPLRVEPEVGASPYFASGSTPSGLTADSTGLGASDTPGTSS
jgi:hypothetical protein